MITLVIITALGMLGLFSEMFRFTNRLRPLIMVGLVVAFYFNWMDWNTDRSWYNQMMTIDNFAVAFNGLMIAVTFLWFTMSADYFREPSSKADHYSIIIFALAGALVLSSFSNLIMLFLGIEILSISMYILAGSNKTEMASNEAALKYFLLGAFATGFLLFGIALVYGATRSFNLGQIALAIGNPGGTSILMFAGILLIMVALAFKISAVPFHFWAPDVYQGSPTIITAFMSTVVKTAAFAAIFRLFILAFSGAADLWSDTLMIIAALTIIVGNITAVYQTNFKRLLAYSSISHAGYMILAILALKNSASSSLFFYTMAYSISSLSAFAILIVVSKKTGNENISSFNGLAAKNPFIAIVTTIAMLSLSGIPPTAGFFAKYYIFSAAMAQHYTGLVIIAVLGSLVGIFYYFRVIIAMFKPEIAQVEVPVSKIFASLLLITSVISVLLGILPGLVTGLLG